MPRRVLRQLGVEAGWNEAEVGGSDLPLPGVAVRIAERLELLQVRGLANVDLRGQVLPDRLLERLAGCQVAAGQRPGAEERLLRPLPDQDLEHGVPDLEHRGQ